MANKQVWWVFGGMGTGFSGPSFLGEVECDTEEEAVRESWDLVVADYESYAGLHGVPSYDEVLSEVREELEGCGEDYDESDIESAANERYDEEIGSWTSHWVCKAVEGVDPEDCVEESRKENNDA